LDDIQAQLLTEQFSRLKDSIDARLRQIETELAHTKKLESERLLHITCQIQAVRDLSADQENRIRRIDDSVISNHASATLIQAGQAALTLIAAALAAWLGGK